VLLLVDVAALSVQLMIDAGPLLAGEITIIPCPGLVALNAGLRPLQSRVFSAGHFTRCRSPSNSCLLTALALVHTRRERVASQECNPQNCNGEDSTVHSLSPFVFILGGTRRDAKSSDGEQNRPQRREDALFNSRGLSVRLRFLERIVTVRLGDLTRMFPAAGTRSNTQSEIRDSQSSGDIIQLRNIEKYFEHGVTKTFVLRRVNLEVKDGEFVSIMGPSGAGKSTLLHLIGMHDSAWAGEYYFLDLPVHKLDKKKRAELHKKYIGFVFQSYHLLDHLTVYENLDIPLSYRDVNRKERESLVCDVLDRFQIVGKKDLYPNQLSGGQQQLVAVARAVIASPKLILADEPTGNLHTSQGQEIMELFRRLNSEGTTIVQVTHSDRNASYGNRVIQISDGWIAKD
jgi:putative ABC transport system ATP-binding protein